MPDLALLDAVVILFLLFRVARARSVALGDSLHGLISLLLLIALFLGFRVASEVRALLSGMSELMQNIPGLGTKLLVIVAAWYLMRLLRTRSGYWIERSIPRHRHPQILPFSEALRAALLAGFAMWLVEGWFDESPQEAPWLIRGVRAGDAWIMQHVGREVVNDGLTPASGSVPPHPGWSATPPEGR